MANGLPPGFEIESSPPPAASPAAPVAAPAADVPAGFEVIDPLAAQKHLAAGVSKVLSEGGGKPEVIQFLKDNNYSVDEPSIDAALAYHKIHSTPVGVNVNMPAPSPPPSAPLPQPATDDSAARWAGLKSGALMGFDDELGAGAGVVGNKIGNWLGMNQSTASSGEIYDAILQQLRDQKNHAYESNPVAYGEGFIPGSILTLPATALRGEQAATLGGRLLQSSAAGAEVGGISGVGNAEGGLGDRLVQGAEGAATGALAAPLLYPVAQGASALVSRAVSPIARRFSGNALNSGLDRLAAVAPQDEQAMLARAREMRRSGVEPRPVDVVDESGRGVIRTAAGKSTPAREDLARHADTVYADAQERISDQARRNIDTNPQTGRQLGRQIEEEQAALGPRFDAVRSNPVAITPEITEAFSTAEGRSALRYIGRWMKPGEQQVLSDMIKTINQNAKLGTPAEQAEKLFPGFSKLSPDAQAKMLPQLGIKEPEVPGLTVDIADKFARRLNEVGKLSSATRRVAKDYSEIVRGAARKQYGDYDQALKDFEATAKVGEAAAGTGAYEDTRFLNSPTDEYGRAVNDASSVPVAGDQPTISEADALRRRARDEVVDRATSGHGANAVGVARQIHHGAGQHARNVALLGEDRAAQLERGMGSEVDRVRNTAYIDPRTGSQTFGRAEDDTAASAVMDMVHVAAGGGKWHLVRTLHKWLRNEGIFGIDAERLTRDAIDPARTNAAIEYLAKRGLDRERAGALVRSIGANLSGRVAAANTTDEKHRQPNSVRSLMRSNP